MTALTNGVLALFFLMVAAVLVIVILYWCQIKKCGNSSNSRSSRPCCDDPVCQGATGCFVLNPTSGCPVFALTLDDSAPSTGMAPVAQLYVKKQTNASNLILTVVSPTGTFVTDIYVDVRPSVCNQAPNFGQTGCAVDLALYPNQFPFTCTGGSNMETVSVPLPTGASKNAALSVVVNVAETCGSPLTVDQLTIEGSAVPVDGVACPTPAFIPRYARIKIPTRCCNAC